MLKVVSVPTTRYLPSLEKSLVKIDPGTSMLCNKELFCEVPLKINTFFYPPPNIKKSKVREYEEVSMLDVEV